MGGFYDDGMLLLWALPLALALIWLALREERHG